MKNSRLPFRPIFGLQRGDVLEVEVSGFYFACKGSEILTPETEHTATPVRSTLKPWQLACCMPVLDDSACWAMGMSSSSGQAMHLAALEEIEARTGLGTEELICPPARSYHAGTNAAQIAGDVPAQRKFHFCCGNHLVIKYACARFGFDAGSYYSRANPFHHKLSRLLHEKMNLAPTWGTDSCGVPTLIAPMRGVARLWQGLAASDDRMLEAVSSLWRSNPLLVGGDDRVDSSITALSGGKVLAKEGADGILALQTFEVDASQNVTLFLKLAQGTSDTYLMTALRCVLERHYDALTENLHLVLEFLRTSKLAALPPTVSLHNLLRSQS
jgi:L-asparaginase II